MKRQILAMAITVGLAAGVHGQGILLENTANSGGPSATSGGLVYMPGGVLFDGINFNLGVTVTAGPNAGSLTPLGLGTYTAATDPKTYTGADAGKFALGATGVGINTGVTPGAPVTIRLQMWYDGAGGLFSSYAAAANGGGLVGDVTFQNPTSNPGGSPPVPDQKLVGMPSVTLAVVPEPSTLALAGLGVASLLVFRRRK